MAKLYFRYGTVGSAKTLNLLAVAHNYRQQGKKVCLAKPALDTRFGAEKIKSRAGLEAPADILIESHMSIPFPTEEIHCLIVDEVQFLEPGHIDQFRRIATERKIPVICYGLRTDFQCKLFPGSRRLLEVADSIEELKTTCYYCNTKAIFNMRLSNGVPVFEGAQIELGADDKYVPACPLHYYEKAKGRVK